MIPSLVEVELRFRRTHPGDISEPSLRCYQTTWHYNPLHRNLYCHHLHKTHVYSATVFAIFFSLFTRTTGFILYIIGIIPALSLRTPVKNDIIQSSDVSFGNIRVTSGPIGRAGWRCVC
jgi:hypothetical protein